MELFTLTSSFSRSSSGVGLGTYRLRRDANSLLCFTPGSLAGPLSCRTSPLPVEGSKALLGARQEPFCSSVHMASIRFSCSLVLECARGGRNPSEDARNPGSLFRGDCAGRQVSKWKGSSYRAGAECPVSLMTQVCPHVFHRD